MKEGNAKVLEKERKWSRKSIRRLPVNNEFEKIEKNILTRGKNTLNNVNNNLIETMTPPLDDQINLYPLSLQITKPQKILYKI